MKVCRKVVQMNHTQSTSKAAAAAAAARRTRRRFRCSGGIYKTVLGLQNDAKRRNNEKCEKCFRKLVYFPMTKQSYFLHCH